MSNYTKTTNFTAKDSMSTGNPLKIVRGAEFDTEFNNIATAVSSKADLASPALTGTATAVNLSISGALNASGDVSLLSNTAVKVPTGTTAQQPGTPSQGMFRFNTTTTQFEGYNGTAWGSIGGGAAGGGTDQIFIQNGQTVTTSYAIPSGQNAMSTGPLTVNSGVTITVPTGSNWVIL